MSSRLGHASPEITVRVYAHAMKEEETDLSFLGEIAIFFDIYG